MDSARRSCAAPSIEKPGKNSRRAMITLFRTRDYRRRLRAAGLPGGPVGHPRARSAKPSHSRRFPIAGQSSSTTNECAGSGVSGPPARGPRRRGSGSTTTRRSGAPRSPARQFRATRRLDGLRLRPTIGDSAARRYHVTGSLVHSTRWQRHPLRQVMLREQVMTTPLRPWLRTVSSIALGY